MRFDPISFVIGLLSGFGMSWVLWRSRRQLSRVQEATELQIEGTRRFIGQAADARYHRDLLRYLQQYHVPGDLIELADVLLEPRLIAPPPPLVKPGGLDTADRDVFEVVPVYHDMPQSYAPFNIKTIPLDDLGSGERHVAILGLDGMGKSTALAILALIALGEVQFETLEDLTEKAIEEEEKGLSEQERKQRMEERRQIQERALEKLHSARAEERELIQGAGETLPPIDIGSLLPILVHLSDLEFDPVLYGKDTELDPTEPLIRAVQRNVTAVTAQMVGSVLYPALEKGEALILLDGYDELSPAVRERYYFWLQQLLAHYGQNMVVIAGEVVGYEPLMMLGFTPTFLRAWRPGDYTRLANQWAGAWLKRREARRREEPIDDQTLRRIATDNAGRSILDVTLKIWTGLADDARETGRYGWYDAYLTRQLSLPEARDLLPALGAQLLTAGQPLKRDVLDEGIAEVLAEIGEQKKGLKPEIVLDALIADGLLVPHAGETIGFRHRMIASYISAELLLDTESGLAVEFSLDPDWQDALAFAAAKIDMTPVIAAKLNQAPDLLYSELFEVTHWLPDAPVDAAWRADLFKRLAGALMAPQQFPVVRERAMAALIASRDRNVIYILRQALRAADPDVRRLACIGLGALGEPDAIKDLMPLLTDEERDVQLAAGLALGAIGTERALEIMVDGLLHGTDELRRAVSEALAAIPGEGHAILRDAIVASELDVRRASVYGLSRVESSWALIALYRAMLEDEQWYVRTAAEEAFLNAQSPEQDGPRAYPEADTLTWLIQWAADRGEGVPAGVNARQVLVRVLQDGEPLFQKMAALTLGRLGHVAAIKPLYAALRDRDDGVRVAAFRALAEIELRLGMPLPGLA